MALGEPEDVEPVRHLDVEAAIPEATRAALEAMGHRLRVRNLGNAHGLMIEYARKGRPRRFLGGTDPRGAGLAEGY